MLRCDTDVPFIERIDLVKLDEFNRTDIDVHRREDKQSLQAL